jgi:hypothetical protein
VIFRISCFKSDKMKFYDIPVSVYGRGRIILVPTGISLIDK